MPDYTEKNATCNKLPTNGGNNRCALLNPDKKVDATPSDMGSLNDGEYYSQVPIPGFEQFLPGILGTAAVPVETVTRIPLPSETFHKQPIYVNAKQYRCILRRRAQRAKQEAKSQLLKVRLPFQHESRHKHAVKRLRGPHGRFLSVEEKAMLAEGGTDAEADADSDCSSVGKAS